MIVTTYNCGCPKKPSPIAESVGLRAPCSPCCFRPSDSSYQLRGHAAQRYVQSRTVEKPKRILSKDKVSCRSDFKNSRYALSYPEYIPSLSSIPPQCSNCCPINTSRISSRRPISATTTSFISKDSMSKQSSRSRSESRLKKKLEMSNKEQEAPTDKIVSEIVKKGQPYKEIEAVINNNRVIIRMHKESVKEEYDPPCECVGQVDAKESASDLKKCDNGVAFDMANGSLELCRTSREDASSMKETGCRTLMLYPNVKDGDNIGQISAASHLESAKDRRSKRLIDLEENPNIFLLRIRKHCDSGDKKQKIDLEFRAPRPWLPRSDKKKEDLTDLSEKLEEQEDKIEENYLDEQIGIYKEANEENNER